MSISSQPILVFGATGQQGGAVAAALRFRNQPVRAIVRDVNSVKAKALAAQGIELVQGDFADTASLRAAIEGTYGVFSVQPSSGQGAAYNITDEDEIRYGKTIVDLAVEAGVRHLVYTSTVAVGSEPTGMGHFDSKREIEAYVRAAPIRSTIVRPATFMEILALPGMGLDQGQFSFLSHPDQKMQLIAAQDIGRIVAAVFSNPEKYAGKTFEIAGDEVSGHEIAAKFSRASGKSITYSRFPDSLLQENAFLAKLVELVDAGRLTGSADLAALRAEFPGLLSLDQWLEGDGKAALWAAIEAKGGGVALR